MVSTLRWWVMRNQKQPCACEAMAILTLIPLFRSRKMKVWRLPYNKLVSFWSVSSAALVSYGNYLQSSTYYLNIRNKAIVMGISDGSDDGQIPSVAALYLSLSVEDVFPFISPHHRRDKKHTWKCPQQGVKSLHGWFAAVTRSYPAWSFDLEEPVISWWPTLWSRANAELSTLQSDQMLQPQCYPTHG